MRAFALTLTLAAFGLLIAAEPAQARGRRTTCGPCYAPCYVPCYAPCYTPCSPSVVFPCFPCPPLVILPPVEDKKEDKKQAKHPPQCDRVFALFIAGTQDKVLAPNIQAGVKSVRALFNEDLLRQKVGERKSDLSGKAATPSAIRAACEKLDLGKNDSVFVFYCGHGGTLAGKGHCLFPVATRDKDKKLVVGEPLPRKDITEILMKKSPRFICFVTDACAGLVEAPDMKDLADPAPKSYSTTDRPAIVKLMVENTGVFDVNSSTPPTGGEDKGQQAILVKGGGLFTKVFVVLARSNRIDKDGDGKVSWKKEFFPLLKEETSKAFQKLRDDPNVDLGVFAGQEEQVPERFPHDEEAAQAPTPLDGAAPATLVASPLPRAASKPYLPRPRRQAVPSVAPRELPTVQTGQRAEVAIPTPAPPALIGR